MCGEVDCGGLEGMPGGSAGGGGACKTAGGIGGSYACQEYERKRWGKGLST